MSLEASTYLPCAVLEALAFEREEPFPFIVDPLLELIEKSGVLGLEQVLEPALGLEPVHKRLFLLGLVAYLQNAVFDLVEGPVTCIDGKLRQLYRIFGLRVPAERAGRHDVHEGRALDGEGLLRLFREVRPVVRAWLRGGGSGGRP